MVRGAKVRGCRGDPRQIVDPLNVEGVAPDAEPFHPAAKNTGIKIERLRGTVWAIDSPPDLLEHRHNVVPLNLLSDREPPES